VAVTCQYLFIGYITKPFKPEDIGNIICVAIGVIANGINTQEPEDSDF